MANNYLGKNFGQFSDAANADGIITKYLNLQGLTDFWSKIKTYVDDQDGALFDATKAKIENVDSTLRSYIESLTINGTQVIKNPAEGVGTGLSVIIGGEDIKVNHDGTDAAEGEKYADGVYTVRGAFDDVDTRLDAMEKAIGENIVNSISVTDTPSTEGTPNYVSFTMDPTGDPKLGTYNVALDVDETKLDAKIAEIDEAITELEANAGVAGIRVVDTDSVEAGEKHTNLVEISLETLQVNDKSDTTTEGSDGETYYKSLVTLKVDETGLAQDLNEIDTAIATEVADRTEDVEKLAGDGYTPASGATAGTWNEGVKYNNITDISERIAQIDENLVTTIDVVDTNAAGAPNWVVFTKADTAADGGDNAVTLTVDESKLGEYITKNETNLSALSGLTVNGHEVITVTAGSGDYAQVTVEHTDVVLSTKDITRNDTAGVAGSINLEDQLNEYDAKLAALASATHFRGKYNKLEEAAAAVLEQGDIVIVGLKEYVYYDASIQVDKDFPADYTPSTTNFIELGDVEEEQTRIENLEDWVDNNIISADEITNIFTTNGAKPTFTF